MHDYFTDHTHQYETLVDILAEMVSSYLVLPKEFPIDEGGEKLE